MFYIWKNDEGRNSVCTGDCYTIKIKDSKTLIYNYVKNKIKKKKESKC